MSTEFVFAEEDFQFIATLMHSRVGIQLPAQKKDMVYARLSRRLRQLGLKDFRSYVARLEAAPEAELERLVNAITTNVTSFFREPHHFQHLAHVVLPALLASQRRGRVRLWSAGCSAGMEAYSMAMVLRDALRREAHPDVKILATDIDTQILATAARGVYDVAQRQKIPADLGRSYTALEEDGKSFSITAEVRSLVHFKPLNLMEAWPMRGPFDVVFCRNVVIYFDKDTQRTLFARMAALMPPGAVLYIGHSESLAYVSDAFELIGQTIYRRRADG